MTLYEDIARHLTERMLRASRGLRSAKSLTVGEWAGMSARFAVRPGAVWQLSSVFCLKEEVPTGATVIGPVGERGWAAMARMVDRPREDHVLIELPPEPSDRLLNDMACLEVAEAIEADAPAVATAKAAEIMEALAFYLEPALVHALDDDALGRLVRAWPLGGMGRGDFVMGAELLHHVLEVGSPDSELGRLPGAGVVPKSTPDATAWSVRVREQHFRTAGGDLPATGQAAFTLHRNGRDWTTKESLLVYGSRVWQLPETTREGSARRVRDIHPQAMPALHAARETALESIRTSPRHCEGFVLATFETLQADTGWGAVLRRELAAMALSKRADKIDDGSRARALRLLTEALRTHTRSALESMRPSVAGLAGYAETLGKPGKEFGGALRGRLSGSMTAQWEPVPTSPTHCTAAAGLALVLLDAQVLGELERSHRNPPALQITTHERVSGLLSPGLDAKPVGGALELVRDGQQVATFRGDAILFEKTRPLLSSLLSHRLLRHEVMEVHRRTFDGDPDARVLSFAGGYEGLADALGCARKAVGELAELIRAQAQLWIRMPNGDEGNLIALREVRGTRAARGRVEITVGTMLVPNAIPAREFKESRWLVPMVALPPFVGRGNEHGAQATLSMEVVRTMRDRHAELLTRGGVHLPPETWDRLCALSGVPKRQRAAIVDRWVRDGEDAPAFLKPVERDHYTLGDAHSGARDFLVAGARLAASAKRGGQARSTAKRRASTRPPKPASAA